MELRKVFVQNLKRYRINKGISQMEIAEQCDISPNYIGQIEIGRRFPSLKLIEKIGNVLEIEPYRFFISETGENLTELEEMINLLAKLPEKQRLEIINRISVP